MALSPAELEMHMVATRAFIEADVETIILTRRTRIADGAGGFKYATPDVGQPEQYFRLIPQSDKVPEQRTSDGSYAVPEYVILGMPDANMKRYDRFIWKGQTWEISQIRNKPDYEKKGDVVRVV